MRGLVETVARAMAEVEAPTRGTARGYATATWPLRHAEARAAIRAVLAQMNEDVRDHTLYRRDVERITGDFAKRHGIDLG